MKLTYGLAICALIAVTVPAGTTPAGVKSASFDFALDDATGAHHTASEWSQARAVVLFFIGVDCPLSNEYAPEMNRLAADYHTRGVLTYAVASDATAAAGDVDAVRRYAKTFALQMPVLLDPHGLLAEHTGATVTPEAAVLSSRGLVVYTGRIDNRVETLGTHRAAPTQFDLRQSLDAVLAGRPVPHERTTAVGCFLPAREKETTKTPTFNKDIAPILYSHCATCHRPGEVAPFSLLTYQDAARHAKTIAKVTTNHVMPPWKAEPGYGEFANERRLTDAEIARLAAWFAAGTPEGDPADKPTPPTFPDGWQAGTPDLVLTTDRAFTVTPDGADQYRCFVLSTNLDHDAYLAGTEFRPGNRRVVHHAILFLDTTGKGRHLDDQTPEPGYPCFGGPGFLPSGAVGGWAPGAMPSPRIDGVAKLIPKGSDIIVQIHYHPSGKPEQDQSKLGLTFSGPPTRGQSAIVLRSRNIDIPAGDPHYVVKTSMTVPDDVDLVGITPHAHYLCKDMKINAELPDGTHVPLIWIKDWDFDWQGQYAYKSPVHLPKGTRIDLEYTYDNSEMNPHQPVDPPVRVTWGEQTRDEMALAFLRVLLPTPERAKQFEQSMRRQYLRTFINGQ